MNGEEGDGVSAGRGFQQRSEGGRLSRSSGQAGLQLLCSIRRASAGTSIRPACGSRDFTFST